MSKSALLVIVVVAALAVLAAALAVGLEPGAPTAASSGGVASGWGGMMGGASGLGMMSGGGPGSSAQAPTSGGRPVTMLIRSDTEHGRRGPDGAWHDAFLPADLTVRPGETVKLTVYNYDDMPHSFTAPMLGVDRTIPKAADGAPSRTVFSFTAPSRTGAYPWWCALPCDPYSMITNGYMRGYVFVTG